MPITVDAVEGALVVRPSYDTAVLALEGGRHRSRVQGTVFPGTAATAGNLDARLPGALWRPAAGEILARAQRAVAARPLRDETGLDRLPNLPGDGPAAWLHQRQAFAFAVEQEAVGLWIAMGGGKSRIGVGLALAHGARNVLVTCPRAVLDEDDVWRKEFGKYAPDAGYLLGGRVKAGRGDGFKARPSVADRVRQLERDRQAARTHGRPFVAVIPWDSFWRGDLLNWVLAQPWDLWLEDEDHHIKAPGGKRSTGAARVRPKAKVRAGLSGTPLPHSRLDAYGVYRALDPGIFGTNYGSFKRRFATWVPLPNTPRAEKVGKWINTEEFDRKFHSIAYVWEQDRAVLGIPTPITVERTVRLAKETWRIYRELDEELIADVGAGIVTADNALVRFLRLQQVLSGVVTLADGVHHRIGTEKRDAFAEWLEDLPQEEPVVAFGQFHADLDSAIAATDQLKRRPAELSGRVRGGLEVWKRGAADVLAVQIQAGGSGIDLTRAAYGAYLSPGLSLGNFDQSVARIDRKGQVWPATFVRFMAVGPRGEETLDHEVYAALDGRRDAVQAVYRARKARAR